jgi:hypothetical protein
MTCAPGGISIYDLLYSHDSVQRVLGRLVSGIEAAVGEVVAVVLPQVDGSRAQVTVLDTPEPDILPTTRHHPGMRDCCFRFEFVPMRLH